MLLQAVQLAATTHHQHHRSSLFFPLAGAPASNHVMTTTTTTPTTISTTKCESVDTKFYPAEDSRKTERRTSFTPGASTETNLLWKDSTKVLPSEISPHNSSGTSIPAGHATLVYSHVGDGG